MYLSKWTLGTPIYYAAYSQNECCNWKFRQIDIFKHPPYRPDLALSDFHLVTAYYQHFDDDDNTNFDS